MIYLATPALFSTWRAGLPALAAWFIVARTKREDVTPRAELDGYRACSERVRYRLLPDVW
jgi:protein-S-isoprenylcysteine O-methyltransferase Ste14